jgi:hypothetical protein
MKPITRIDMYLAVISGDEDAVTPLPEPITRIDMYLASLAGMDVAELPEPITRIDYYLAALCGMNVVIPDEPVTRIDFYLAALNGQTVDTPEAITRIDHYLDAWAGGSSSLTSLRGPSPLSLANAVKGRLKKLVQYGKVSVSDGVITCNNGVLSADGDSIITTGTAEEVTVTRSDSTTETVSDIPNLYAVDSLCDEHDIITGKTIRRTEATVYDSSNPPTGRFIGNATDGSVIIEARETVYEDDAVVSFEADEETPLNLVKAEFSPVQDLHGYDAPWPAGGGKNKLGWLETGEAATVITFEKDTSVFTIGSNLTTPVGWRAGDKCKVTLEAGTYYLSSNITGQSLGEGVFVYNVSTSSILARARNEGGASFTLSEQTTVALGLNLHNPTTAGTFYFQLESGSSATSFSPYSNECPISGWTALDIYNEPEYDPTATPKLTVTWQDEVGTVCGGRLTINRDGSVDLVKTIVRPQFVGTEGYTQYGQYVVCSRFETVGKGEYWNMLCSHVKVTNGTVNWSNSSKNHMQFRIADFGASDVDAFKALLVSWNGAGNPVQVSYPLATPVTYHLPSIDALKALKGINTMWTDANGKITVAVADADVIEQNTPHAITVEDGTNTVSWTAEVSGKEMEVEYRTAPTNSPVRALNILLNGNYTNDGGPDDISDKEALEIIGGKK